MRFDAVGVGVVVGSAVPDRVDDSVRESDAVGERVDAGVRDSVLVDVGAREEDAVTEPDAVTVAVVLAEEPTLTDALEVGVCDAVEEGEGVCDGVVVAVWLDVVVVDALAVRDGLGVLERVAARRGRGWGACWARRRQERAAARVESLTRGRRCLRRRARHGGRDGCRDPGGVQRHENHAAEATHGRRGDHK